MRFARVAACTAATALLTTATAGAASAATASDEMIYEASTRTGVVQVALQLPIALPGVPNPAVITLLGTDAQAIHGPGGSGDLAEANSYLAGGSLITDSPLAALFAPLNRTLSSDLANPGAHTGSVVAVPSNPLGLDLTVGGQSAGVNPLSRLTTSSGSLADVQLGSLRALGLGDALDTALAQLNSALATLLSTAAPVTSVLAGLPALPSISIPNPLAGVLPGVPAQIATPALSGAALAGAVTELPAQVKVLTDQLLDGALVEVSALDTDQSIAPSSSAVTAAGRSAAANVKVFGGLVTLTATEANASATAGLTKSAANSAASATLLEVKVSTALSDLLQVIASDKGITLGLLDGSLLGTTLDILVRPAVQALDGALNTLLAQLTGLLETLNSGASLIQQGTVTQKVSADGRLAEAHAVPAQVTIGLPIAPDLLTIAIGQADAVSALSVWAPTVTPPGSTPPGSTPPGVTPPGQLPRTGLGDSLPLLAVVLVGMAGTAVVLRRRTRT
ncbi:MAG: hypothetical protein JWN87_2662 [Frankiales bacterium]|nr:hypothetical protein [Frankiales bacterium]